MSQRERERQRDRVRRAQLSFTPTADCAESEDMADTVALWGRFLSSGAHRLEPSEAGPEMN